MFRVRPKPIGFNDDPKHLLLHEKVKLLKISCEHGARLLQCPASGKNAEDEAWMSIMEEFLTEVRADVFTDQAHVRRAIKKICRNRRERTKGIVPPQRRASMGELDTWIDRWVRIWKCRDLMTSIAKVHQSILETVGEKKLKRIFCHRIDGNELPQELGLLTFSAPLWKAIQKEFWAAERSWGRRHWSTVPSDDRSDWTDEDDLEDDTTAEEVVEEEPLQSIEEETQNNPSPMKPVDSGSVSSPETNGESEFRAPSPRIQASPGELEQDAIAVPEVEKKTSNKQISALSQVQRCLHLEESPSSLNTSRAALALGEDAVQFKPKGRNLEQSEPGPSISLPHIHSFFEVIRVQPASTTSNQGVPRPADLDISSSLEKRLPSEKTEAQRPIRFQPNAIDADGYTIRESGPASRSFNPHPSAHEHDVQNRLGAGLGLQGPVVAERQGCPLSDLFTRQSFPDSSVGGSSNKFALLKGKTHGTIPRRTATPLRRFNEDQARKRQKPLAPQKVPYRSSPSRRSPNIARPRSKNKIAPSKFYNTVSLTDNPVGKSQPLASPQTSGFHAPESFASRNRSPRRGSGIYPGIGLSSNNDSSQRRGIAPFCLTIATARSEQECSDDESFPDVEELHKRLIRPTSLAAESPQTQPTSPRYPGECAKYTKSAIGESNTPVGSPSPQPRELKCPLPQTIGQANQAKDVPGTQKELGTNSQTLLGSRARSESVTAPASRSKKRARHQTASKPPSSAGINPFDRTALLKALKVTSPSSNCRPTKRRKQSLQSESTAMSGPALEAWGPTYHSSIQHWINRSAVMLHAQDTNPCSISSGKGAPFGQKGDWRGNSADKGKAKATHTPKLDEHGVVPPRSKSRGWLTRKIGSYDQSLMPTASAQTRIPGRHNSKSRVQGRKGGGGRPCCNTQLAQSQDQLTVSPKRVAGPTTPEGLQPFVPTIFSTTSQDQHTGGGRRRRHSRRTTGSSSSSNSNSNSSRFRRDVTTDTVEFDRFSLDRKCDVLRRKLSRVEEMLEKIGNDDLISR
ncbi:hypothetical protein AAE478_000010 [Parahypoxylon ruwenzoriense]